MKGAYGQRAIQEHNDRLEWIAKALVKRNKTTIRSDAIELEQQGKVLAAAFWNTLLDPESPEPKIKPLVRRAMQKAKQAWKRAYAPFSHFLVGATVISGSGKIWAGCNVECSSYGLTLCAERNALTTAVAGGEREIIATVVYTEQVLTPPCGACCQMLYDFGSESVVIVTNGQRQLWFLLKDLLPVTFTAALLRSIREVELTTKEK